MDVFVDRMKEEHRDMVLRTLASYESYVASQDKGMKGREDRNVERQHTTKDETKFHDRAQETV